MSVEYICVHSHTYACIILKSALVCTNLAQRKLSTQSHIYEIKTICTIDSTFHLQRLQLDPNTVFFFFLVFLNGLL